MLYQSLQIENEDIPFEEENTSSEDETDSIDLLGGFFKFKIQFF